jgi:hypothetical protein
MSQVIGIVFSRFFASKINFHEIPPGVGKPPSFKWLQERRRKAVVYWYLAKIQNWTFDFSVKRVMFASPMLSRLVKLAALSYPS